jgi:hypothetical protein
VQPIAPRVAQRGGELIAPLNVEPTGCTLAELEAGALQGRVMLVGESLSRSAFDELLTWVRRMGSSLRCVDTPDVVRHTGAVRSPEATAVDEHRYSRRPVGCTGQNLRPFSRRMNLLSAFWLRRS